MAAAEEMYEIQVHQSRRRGHAKQIVVYIFKKCGNYNNDQLAYLEGEKKEFDLCWIFTKEFNCKNPSSNTLKIIVETGYSHRIKEIDRSRVDGMSFGEKKVFTVPNNARVLNVIIIDEDDGLLVTESLNGKVSHLDSSHESRPGVEGDDTTELVRQFICMMLIVYTLYSSFTMRQPRFR